MDKKILIDLLVEIAQLEKLRLDAGSTLERNEEIRFSLEELQAEYEQDAARAAKANQGASVTLRGLDREMRQVEELLKVKRDMEIGLTDCRQLRALKEEIQALEQRLEKLEERGIGLLEKQDELDGAERDSARESRDHEQQAEERKIQMAAESRSLTERARNIDEELKRLLGMLPEGHRRHVERLRSRGEQAVVHLRDGACLGCFNTLPRQQALDVDQGRDVVRCPSCMRYIVHESWK